MWRGVWSGSTQTIDEVTFWGANGQKLATYALSVWQQYPQYSSQPYLVATSTGTNYYFGGKLIKNTGGYVTPDRLGSNGKYFPYGQERPSATTDGKEKFATYFRDSETGLDYADQRYHQPGMGRFMRPDSYGGSAKAKAPGSWNRYAYVGGDPVNTIDPTGQEGLGMGFACDPGTNAMCSMMLASVGFYGDTTGGGGGGGGGPAFYDPNPSVFAYDLGQVGPGSGNSSIAFSGAYDLNNGAPGFGPDPNNGNQNQTCLEANITQINNVSNLNVSPSNLANPPYMFNGGRNFDFSVSGASPSDLAPGRYPSSTFNSITGIGHSLHVTPPNGVDPSTYGMGPGGAFTFTTHIDSAYSTWYTPIGAFIHWFVDVREEGAHRGPC